MQNNGRKLKDVPMIGKPIFDREVLDQISPEPQDDEQLAELQSRVRGFYKRKPPNRPIRYQNIITTARVPKWLCRLFRNEQQHVKLMLRMSVGIGSMIDSEIFRRATYVSRGDPDARLLVFRLKPVVWERLRRFRQKLHVTKINTAILNSVLASLRMSRWNEGFLDEPKEIYNQDYVRFNPEWVRDSYIIDRPTRTYSEEDPSAEVVDYLFWLRLRMAVERYPIRQLLTSEFAANCLPKYLPVIEKSIVRPMGKKCAVQSLTVMRNYVKLKGGQGSVLPVDVPL